MIAFEEGTSGLFVDSAVCEKDSCLEHSDRRLLSVTIADQVLFDQALYCAFSVSAGPLPFLFFLSF